MNALRYTLLLAPANHICRYERWSKAITKAAHSVAVLYASDYGFSDRLAQVGRPG